MFFASLSKIPEHFANMYRVTSVVSVVVDVGATTVLKALPRGITLEDCRFQGTLETAVRLRQWCARTQSVVSLIKFINDKYCTSFRSHSLLLAL